MTEEITFHPCNVCGNDVPENEGELVKDEFIYLCYQSCVDFYWSYMGSKEEE